MVPEKSPLEDAPRDGENFFKLVFEIKLKKMCLQLGVLRYSLFSNVMCIGIFHLSNPCEIAPVHNGKIHANPN